MFKTLGFLAFCRPKWLLLLLTTLVTIAAHAQTVDDYPVGQPVDAISFEQAIEKMPKVTPRDEFETTSQYEARRAKEIGETVGPLIILKEPEDRDKHIRYDADAGQFNLISYAFKNMTFYARDAFYGTPEQELLKASIWNHDVVISQEEQTNGTYVGQNAYGASWEITRVTRVVQAIYERPADRRPKSLFPDVDQETMVVGKIPMAPDIAKRTKPTLKLAFVVEPREPFLVQSKFKTQTRITRQYPFDIKYDSTALIGDIQFALVLDESNRVLAVFPTW